MAATVGAPIVEGVPGETPVSSHFDVTPDTSYPTGGYAITAAQAGFSANIRNLVAGLALLGATYYYAFWDRVNGKLKFIVATTGVEVTAATNLSTMTPVRCTAWGD
jgi:hypothetical protein